MFIFLKAKNGFVLPSGGKNCLYFCRMYFMPKHRYNQNSGKDELYLALKESFRDKAGRVHTRTLLTVGFVSELQPCETAEVARCLTYRSEHRNQTEEKKSQMLPSRPTIFDFICVIGWEKGLEPSTLGSTILYSNQLSYTHHFFCAAKLNKFS